MRSQVGAYSRSFANLQTRHVERTHAASVFAASVPPLRWLKRQDPGRSCMRKQVRAHSRSFANLQTRHVKRVKRGLFVRTHLMLISVAILTATPSLTRAEDVMEPSLRGSDRIMSLPYGFWNESFGVAAAYVYAVNGYPQPQAGADRHRDGRHHRLRHGVSSWGRTFRLFDIERLLFDPILSVGYFGDIEAYVDGNPDFADDTRRQQRVGRGRLHRGQRLGHVLPIPVQVPAADRQRRATR